MSIYWYPLLVVLIPLLIWWWFKNRKGKYTITKEEKISPDYIRTTEGMIERKS